MRKVFKKARRVIPAAVLVLVSMGMLNQAARLLPPCQYEDSSWCYWDGDTRGNKTGVSYINLGGHKYYL